MDSLFGESPRRKHLGGVGPLPNRNGAMARVRRLLVRTDQRHLPVHVPPPPATSSQRWPVSYLVLLEIADTQTGRRVFRALWERWRLQGL